MSISAIRLLAVILASLAATPAAAQRRPRVAILEVRALGIAPEKAQALSEVALTEASNIAGLDVIGRSDIQSMIGFEKEKQMLGCSDDSKCMTEIAGAMGVDWILVGSLGQFDALYRLDLKLIDAKRSRIAGRIGESIEGSQARLVSAVQAGVHKLLDPIARAAAEAANRPPPSEKPAPRAEPPPTERVAEKASVQETPAPERTRAERPAAEPSETAPSSAIPEGPITRPWSVELRLGIARFGGGNVEPAALRPGGFGELDLVGAYRLNRRWSFHLALVSFTSSTRGMSLPIGTASLLIGPGWGAVGAAWHPRGNPYFSVAADVGFARATAEARVLNVTSSESRSGVVFGLEARADYPLGERWFVGARLGLHQALMGFDLRVREPATGQEVRFQNDMGFISGLVATGYRF